MLSTCVLLVAGAFLVSATFSVQAATRATASSDFFNLDTRESFGGRLVQGQVRVSPTALTSDPHAALTIHQVPPPDWTSQQPFWQSQSLSDGWYEATLSEQGLLHRESLTVLNNDQVIIHGGVLEASETWSSSKVHLIKHWVRIPLEITLNIEEGSIVKICPHAGMVVDGNLVATHVTFTTADDDTAGGDTNLNGPQTDEGDVDIVIHGNATLTDADVRLPKGIPINMQWTADVVHIIRHVMIVPPGKRLSIQAGAIVKLATGARLEVAPGGNIACAGVVFTHLFDNTIGGESAHEDQVTHPPHDQYQLTGFTPPRSCDLRYLSFLYSGWNLVTPGSDILDTPYNRLLLKQFGAFTFHQGQYQKINLPVTAGTGLWLYSRKPQVASFNYASHLSNNAQTPLILTRGWNMIGIPGEASQHVKLGERDIVWQRNVQTYELMKPTADSTVNLRAGRAYFIYHAPKPDSSPHTVGKTASVAP